MVPARTSFNTEFSSSCSVLTSAFSPFSNAVRACCCWLSSCACCCAWASSCWAACRAAPAWEASRFACCSCSSREALRPAALASPLPDSYTDESSLSSAPALLMLTRRFCVVLCFCSVLCFCPVVRLCLSCTSAGSAWQLLPGMLSRLRLLRVVFVVVQTA